MMQPYNIPEVRSFTYYPNIMREMFAHLNKPNRYRKGLEFFSGVASLVDANVFSNTKAYAIYFAYQLKSYENVKHIRDTFFIELRSDGYKDAYDFTMMNFYKGLIYLADYVSLIFIQFFNFKFSRNSTKPQSASSLDLKLLSAITPTTSSISNLSKDLLFYLTFYLPFIKLTSPNLSLEIKNYFILNL